MRIHFGTGKPISNPGGTHSVILGLAHAQEQIGASVIVVDQIKLFGPKYHMSSSISITSSARHVNEFHFCLSALHILIRNPFLILRAKMNILHFHGPWHLESKFQDPSARLRNFFKFIIEFIVVRSFQNIICVSQAFAEILISQYRVRPERITVIPAGIDTERFAPLKNMDLNRRTDRKFHIGTVRRLVPRMGLEILIESMSYMPDCRLTLVGTGISETDLRDLCLKLGISDRVDFAGYVEDSKLADFYRNLDLCVIPSVALEGFCITAIEAMACGIPVIASNLDGLKESVGSCSGDLLFEPNSSVALADKVSQIRKEYVGEKELFRIHAMKFDWLRIALRLESEVIKEDTRNNAASW